MKIGFNAHLGAKSQFSAVHMFRNKILQAVDLQIIDQPDPNTVTFDAEGWPNGGFDGVRGGYMIRCLNYAMPLTDPFSGLHYLVQHRGTGREPVRVTWDNDPIALNPSPADTGYVRTWLINITPGARQLKIYVNSIDNASVPKFELYHSSDFGFVTMVSDYWKNFHKDTEVLRLMAPQQINRINPIYASTDGQGLYSYDEWSYVGNWQKRNHLPLFAALVVYEEMYYHNGKTIPYFNLPVNISNEVATEFFRSLKISPFPEYYIELGNELWHDSTSFECFGYLRDEAIKKWGLMDVQFDANGKLVDDPSNGWIVSKADLRDYFGNNILNVTRNVSHPAYTEAEAVYQMALYVYERLMKLYDQVNGSDKAKWVIGINGGWGSHFSRYIADSTLAEKSVKDYVLNKMYAIAPALYMTNHRSVTANGEPTDLDELFSQFNGEVDQYINSVKTNVQQSKVRYPHLEFILYEFGYSGVPRNKQDQAVVDLYWQAAEDPRMYHLYKKCLDAMDAEGCQLVLHYEDTTPYSLARYGRWGVTEYTRDTSIFDVAGARIDALKDYVISAPPVVVPPPPPPVAPPSPVIPPVDVFINTLDVLMIDAQSRIDMNSSVEEVFYWDKTFEALERTLDFYQTGN